MGETCSRSYTDLLIGEEDGIAHIHPSVSLSGGGSYSSVWLLSVENASPVAQF